MPTETPREPDRFDKIALEIWGGDFTPAGFAAALRAVESEALERAAQVVDDEDEGPHGMDYQLGDVSDFRARCVKAIRALKQSHERSNDEVANVELRMSSTAVDAAGVGRDAPVPPQGKAPSHPAGDALKSAAAPAGETGKARCPNKDPYCSCQQPMDPAPAQEAEARDGEWIAALNRFWQFCRCDQSTTPTLLEGIDPGCDACAPLRKLLAARAAPQSGEGNT